MKQYTHTDNLGVKWRFEGSKPISELADLVMDDINTERKKQKKFKTKKKIK